MLRENKEGLRVTTILKLTGLPQRTAYNNLRKMMENKILLNAYPIWKIANNYADSPKLANLLSNDKIQAHKFSFILRLINKPKWWEKRNNQLMKLREFSFKPVDWGSGYEQLKKDNFIIQTFSNSIIIINQKKYWGNDPYDCFIASLEDALQMYQFIEERFKFKFFNDEIPQFSIRSHHYVKVRDSIAKKCKKEGNIFKLEINEKLRAWIDMSEPFGMEFGHKNYAPEDARRYKQVVEDYIENNSSLPSEIDSRISKLSQLVTGVTENQMVFDANMKSHLKVLNKLGDAVRELNKQFKKSS